MKILKTENPEQYIGQYPRWAGNLENLEQCIEEYVLPGFIPAQPLLDRETNIRVQGSCFALNLGTALIARGAKVRMFEVTERGNTPKNNVTVLQEWKKENNPRYHTIAEDNVIIITLGVADGSVEDNRNAIGSFVKILREVNPELQIVLTVSPVPLNRSILPSAVVADCISKCTLRAAVAEYLAKPDQGIYYWPSFEMVRWLGAHLPPVYGADDGQLRHVNKAMVDLIVTLFLKHYARAA